MMTGVKQKRHRVSVKCRVCHGLGYCEYEAGLIRLPCRRCKGTGRIIKLKVIKGEKRNVLTVKVLEETLKAHPEIKGPTHYVEALNEHTSDSGAGQDNQPV